MAQAGRRTRIVGTLTLDAMNPAAHRKRSNPPARVHSRTLRQNLRRQLQARQCTAYTTFKWLVDVPHACRAERGTEGLKHADEFPQQIISKK